MRFLIGIITGAVLTLFIATAVDAPTQSTLNRVRGHLETIWDGLIDSTSDSLFQAGDTAPPVQREEHPPALALVAPEQIPPAPPAEQAPSGDTMPEAISEAIPEIGYDLIAQAEPPLDFTPIDDLSNDFIQNSEDDSASDFDSTLPPRTYDEQAPTSLASVWIPFHSQMSAEGFADRLSRELDHSFRVERQGAGAYQVVFDADSTAERDLLLTRVAEITGQ